MQKIYNIYYNLGYWFLLLIVLVFAGFYKSYFVVFFQPHAPIIHIHFVLMVLWIVMLITQPFLIKYKKFAIHRMLGKISYVLVPLVLASAFLMIRYSYYNFVVDLNQKAVQGLHQFTNDQVLQHAAVYEAIAFFYLFSFATFYSLAILNRRKMAVHARYMMATALALLGPTVDRIVFFYLKLPAYIPYELPSLIIIDILLALLLLKDYKDKRPTKTLWICLLIYGFGQVLYFTIPHTNAWQNFVTFIMKPGP